MTLVEALPDWTDPRAVDWLDNVAERAARVPPSSAIQPLTGEAVAGGLSGGPLAGFGVPTLRRFVLGLLAVDFAVYEKPSDRVDIERLAYVVSKFPSGFVLWFAQGDEGPVPVGYTGFYPISQQSFRRIQTGEPPLEDRFLHPVTPVRPTPHPFLYIFNFSIVSALRSASGSAGAGVMMRALNDALVRQAPSGMSAITVSPEGSRLCQRLGLGKTCEFKFEGEKEDVYATPPGWATAPPTQT